MWTDLKRISRSGFLSFWRNKFVSLASMLVITVTLFVVGSLIFVSAALDTALANVKAKVDVDVYFATEAPEEEILGLKKLLLELPEVASVEYTTKESALEQFKKRHESDYLTLQALDEIGENPLGASLNILAKETSQYETITRFLENQTAAVADAGEFVDSINFYQNKGAIDTLTRIITGAENVGFAAVLALAAISLIITFNTIRLAIYSAREEIAVMRLVGASKRYIQGPFVVEGLLYGLISACVAILVFFPLTYWLGDKVEQFFGGINVYSYYLANFLQIAAILLGVGVVLGVGSSFFAVRRYIAGKYITV
ncbi:MAG: FtsX-like permease family protein [Parcubacteria group bacterium]|nr:FtsX-like permease family protein [Parcubacteria group bacterium]